MSKAIEINTTERNAIVGVQEVKNTSESEKNSGW